MSQCLSFLSLLGTRSVLPPQSALPLLFSALVHRPRQGLAPVLPKRLSSSASARLLSLPL
jgi:hypothetical protein